MTQISCPGCAATNNVPEGRLADGPHCGRCKSLLFRGEPVELVAANVANMLQFNDIPVVVDCWAAWCGPCRQFAPTFAAAAAALEPALRFAKLDTEAEPAIAGQWNIRSIPTLILFDHGREVQRIAGALSPPQLRAWLSENGVRAA